jgi:hypothetical protein
MREILFKCDNCKKELSGNGKDREHISIEFNKGKFGLAQRSKQKSQLTDEELESQVGAIISNVDGPVKISDEKNPGWELYPFPTKSGYLQFCDEKCFAKWIENKVGEIKLGIMNK